MQGLEEQVNVLKSKYQEKEEEYQALEEKIVPFQK